MFQFHFARRCFRIRLWPALACLLVIGVTLSAARWQTARAHYKQSRADAYAAQQRQPALDLDAWSGQAPPEFARATVSGTWRDEVLIYADNQVRDGQAGFLVHMPLCQTEKRCVLVARGWVRHGGRRDVLPPVASPAGPQRIEGVVTRAQPRFVELSADAIQGAVWQNVTVDRVAKTTGLQLAPFILVQTGDAADDLRRDDVKPEFGVEKHWMYAAQWYAFALVTLVFGLYAAMQKEGEKS